jgi:hypothetical protein
MHVVRDTMTKLPKPPVDRRELEAELEEIRRTLESFEAITEISDDVRELIEARWPHLLAKIKPAKGH